MNTPTPVKITSIAAIVVIGIWAVLSGISIIFQDALLDAQGATEEIINSGTIIPFSLLVELVCAAALIISCTLMLTGRMKALPLVISAVSAAVSPVLVGIISTTQTVIGGYSKGAVYIARIGTVTRIENMLSYLLSMAAIMTVAAAAVYLYSKKVK